MSFGGLIERTRAESQLFLAMLELTYRCNLDCAFCYNDVSLAGRPLTLPQYEKLLLDLARMRTLYVTLTGGEPLSHPDFFAIGRKARELGFVVQVKSNGHALRGKLARRLLEEVDPFLVEISLHGARPASHDRQTRIAGSFERLMANLDELRALGLRVKLNATLTRWNEDEVADMYGVADRLGLILQVDTEVTPRDDGDRSPLDLTASDDGLRRLFAVQRRRAEAASVPVAPAGGATPPRPSDDPLAGVPGGMHCGAGTASVTVDPYGNVYPCVQWRVPVGNLHDATIEEIWRGSKALDKVRGENAAVRGILSAEGSGADALGFCPGAAALATGSPLALYPAALRRRDLRPGETPSVLLPALPSGAR